jgi:hypothetical protein
MAVKVSRVVPFGSSTRSFRLVNVNDRARDQKQYEEGLALEQERFQPGSISQQVFDRLSLVHHPEGLSTDGPADKASEPVDPVKDDAA